MIPSLQRLHLHRGHSSAFDVVVGGLALFDVCQERRTERDEPEDRPAPDERHAAR